jgi:gamma-D-glutamyl-L-lysine dipeptidyl-peptidase
MTNVLVLCLLTIVQCLFVTIVGEDKTQRLIEMQFQDADGGTAAARMNAGVGMRLRKPADSATSVGQKQSGSPRGRASLPVRRKAGRTMPDSGRIASRASFGNKELGVVTVSVGNIRSKPTDLAELASQALLGTPLRILKKAGRWYNVQTPDGYRGWMDDGFVLMDKEQFEQWTEKKKIIVTTEFGFAFRSEEKKDGVVSDIVIGSLLALKNVTATNYEVEYPDGRVGFLPKESAQMYDTWVKMASATPESVVATANRFMGIPYLWGGTSAKGFDCSGFTKTVFFLNGLLLPRDASQQARVGEPIAVGEDFENLRTGDLLFFGAKQPAGKKTKVINASGDVRINSLNPADTEYAKHRRETFLGARRIIGAEEKTGVRRLLKLTYYKGHEL